MGLGSLFVSSNMTVRVKFSLSTLPVQVLRASQEETFLGKQPVKGPHKKRRPRQKSSIFAQDQLVLASSKSCTKFLIFKRE